MLEKAAKMDLAFYETPSFYDRMSNALNESWRVHNVSYGTLEFLSGFVSLTAMLALLTVLHPLAILLLLLTSVPQTVALVYHTKRRHTVWTDRSRLRRMFRYLGDLVSSRDAVKEMRLFGLQSGLIQKSRETWRIFFEDDRKYRFALARSETLLGMLSMVGTAGIWAFAVLQGVHRKITIGDVALVFQAAEQTRSALRQTFQRGTQVYENRLYAEALFDFLDLDPTSVAGSLTVTSTPSVVPRPIGHGIEFQDVTFRYPGTESDVLQDLSFHIPSGSSVALVGENGAGKTTLVKLLTRLYDPVRGRILVDGVDLRDLDPDAWRREIGVLFQDYVRYDLTARENIGFGQVEHLQSPGHVERATHLGGARSVIDSLPDAYDTVLGRTFDDGVDLSGGQWQRIALSRGYMRDAQILVLDEPTSALDALAEYEVYSQFAELTRGKTTILISHRFSTVRMTESIIVLERGRLVEAGTHGELLDLDGHYARMYNTQADRYR